MPELLSASPAGEPSAARFRRGLRSALRLALDFALPQLCPSCREPLGDGNGLCAHCWSKLSLIAPPYCARLGIPFAYDPGPGVLSMEAITDPPAYHRARAAVRYDDIARTLVHALIPVPLHWRRLWARRFNQSALLAKAIGKESGIAIVDAALKRVKATAQQ